MAISLEASLWLLGLLALNSLFTGDAEDTSQSCPGLEGGGPTADAEVMSQMGPWGVDMEEGIRSSSLLARDVRSFRSPAEGAGLVEEDEEAGSAGQSLGERRDGQSSLSRALADVGQSIAEASDSLDGTLLGTAGALEMERAANKTNSSAGLCVGGKFLNPMVTAGSSCSVKGKIKSESQCRAKNGQWRPYSCRDVENYWKRMGGESWIHSHGVRTHFHGKCCTDKAAPPPKPLCADPKLLNETAIAGYSCSVEGDTGSEEKCWAKNGTWHPYSCRDAANYWMHVGGESWKHAPYLGKSWRGKCCTGTAPPPPKAKTPAPGGPLCADAKALKEAAIAGHWCTKGA